MILTPAQLQDARDPFWFCLRTQPKREHLAASHLRQFTGIECFCPRIRFRKAIRRGAVWFVEALFPGYIFARFDYASIHRQVQYSPGVLTVLRFGNGIAAIDEASIEMLRQISGAEELILFDPELKIGDPVCVMEGAFAGLQAVVTQLLPAKDRVKVLLQFLGRPVEVDIPIPKILSPETPRKRAL